MSYRHHKFLILATAMQQSAIRNTLMPHLVLAQSLNYYFPRKITTLSFAGFQDIKTDCNGRRHIVFWITKFGELLHLIHICSNETNRVAMTN